MYDSFQQRPDYFFNEAYSAAWEPFLRKMLIHRLHLQHPESLLKTTIIKEPNGSWAADILMRVLPEAKLLVLLRDPRDLIDSRMDMHTQESWAQSLAGENGAYRDLLDKNSREVAIKYYCYYWNALIDIIMRAIHSHPASRTAVVKYEELRRQTKKTLGGIHQFLGLNTTAEDVQALATTHAFEKLDLSERGPGKFCRKASPGSWRDSFTNGEIALMEDLMGSRMAQLGYTSH
ncbi:MAG: hypothetical protein QOE70_6485 [Chthoniobacter sp.]|nr:hypothetical protein [Chthoniobacter sp.]